MVILDCFSFFLKQKKKKKIADIILKLKLKDSRAVLALIVRTWKNAVHFHFCRIFCVSIKLRSRNTPNSTASAEDRESVPNRIYFIAV